jgi:DNA-binding protein H-NS
MKPQKYKQQKDKPTVTSNQKNGQTPSAKPLSLDSLDFSTLSLKQLQTLQEKMAEATEAARETKRGEIKSQIETMLADNGFSLEDIFPSTFRRQGTRRDKGTTVEIAYRNPDDPAQTWTGRGRVPRWLQAKIDEGLDRESFRIRGTAPAKSVNLAKVTSQQATVADDDEQESAAA